MKIKSNLSGLGMFNVSLRVFSEADDGPSTIYTRKTQNEAKAFSISLPSPTSPNKPCATQHCSTFQNSP